MQLNHDTFVSQFPKFNDQLPVYCRDGNKLGRIILVAEESIIVEKGVFFPRDFCIHYDEIFDVRDDQVILKESSDELEHWKDESFPGWSKMQKDADLKNRKAG